MPVTNQRLRQSVLNDEHQGRRHSYGYGYNTLRYAMAINSMALAITLSSPIHTASDAYGLKTTFYARTGPNAG